MTRPAWCGEHPCGSREAFDAGCRADSCRLMMVLHTSGLRSVPIPEVRTIKRDAEPYAKLLRQLLREGHTLRQLSKRADYSAVALRNIAMGVTSWIYPATARAIERLVATLPSEASESVS